MLTEWTLVGLMALNLSYTPVEGLQQHAGDVVISQNTRGRIDNNPFSGVRNIDVILDREEWDTPKEPIPYIGYWANEIGQTAQQMIAICSILETEAEMYCLADE